MQHCSSHLHAAIIVDLGKGIKLKKENNINWINFSLFHCDVNLNMYQLQTIFNVLEMLNIKINVW